MDRLRRRMLRGGVATTFFAGYSEPLEEMAHGLSGSPGEKLLHPIYGNAPAPEYRMELTTGDLEINKEQRLAFTACYGCTTQCEVRSLSAQRPVRHCLYRHQVLYKTGRQGRHGWPVTLGHRK